MRRLVHGALGGARQLDRDGAQDDAAADHGAGSLVAFRCRIWNIGGEGQYLMGALAGTLVGLLGQASLPAWLLIPLMLLAGIAGGALWAGLAAWLRLGVRGQRDHRHDHAELRGALRRLLPGARALARPHGLPAAERQARGRGPAADALPGSRMHLGVLLALLLVPAIYVLLWTTTVQGFRLRAIGSSARRGAGHRHERPAPGSPSPSCASGALAGLAGIIEVSALHARLKDGISGDYGFTGILVALLGRLHPVGVLLGGAVLRGPDDRHPEHAQRAWACRSRLPRCCR